MQRLSWSIDCRSPRLGPCIGQTEQPTRELALEHFREHYDELQLDTLRCNDITDAVPAIDEKEWARDREEERLWREEERSPYEPGTQRLKPPAL